MGSRKTGFAAFVTDPRTAEYAVLPYPCEPDFMVIKVPRSLMAEGEVQFPPEPPLGTVVRAKVEDADRPQILERSDDHVDGDGWYMAGYNRGFTWDELNKLGEPEILWKGPYNG